LLKRDKVNLDLTFLKDKSLSDADAMQAPEVLVQEIIDDLQAALTEFQAIGEALGLDPAELEPELEQLSTSVDR
jgi:type I restriction enzyme M protein